MTRNKNGSVEVIFQKPLAASKDDCSRNLSGELLVRKQSFKKLLKLIRFAEVSKESLELLADNDLVMGSKETRDIIRQALELVNSAPTSAVSISASSVSAASIDTEDTVVFVTVDNPSTIYAYSLDRGDIFKFIDDYYEPISNIHTHHNKLFCHILFNRKSEYPYLLKMAEFPFSKQMGEIFHVKNYSVIVGEFCYTVNNYMFRRNIHSGDWYKLFSPAETISSPLLTVFKDSILHCNSSRDSYGQQKVYCFNTMSKKCWHVLTCDYKNCNFVTFTHNDQLYILYSNGVFTDVTNSVISPTEAFTLPKYEEISKSCLLWDFELKIYGAVARHDTLIVFGEVSSILVSEIHECKIPGLKAVKFVHLYGLSTKCYPLVIPTNLLTQRM